MHIHMDEQSHAVSVWCLQISDTMLRPCEAFSKVDLGAHNSACQETQSVETFMAIFMAVVGSCSLLRLSLISQCSCLAAEAPCLQLE
jgi:hypothetical protein